MPVDTQLNGSAQGSPSPPPIPIGNTPIGDSIISWLTEKVREAEDFLQAQPGWSKIEQAIAAINGDDKGYDPTKKLSQTRTNRIGKIFEDLAALLTDTKPFWDYQVSNRRFEQHANNYGKLATYWYQGRNIDLRLAECIQYYAAAGTGYLHVYWDPEIGDIAARSLDPRNVLPIRPKNYESLESCSGVVVRDKVPVNYIRDRYNEQVDPDSDGSAQTWLENAVGSVNDNIVSPIMRWVKGSNKKTSPELPRIPTVWLYTCYLKDSRTNDTKSTVYMGDWERNAETGEMKALQNWSYKVAPDEDLYPHRRMIVWAGSKKLYDGPSYYWHGQFPIIKLTLQPRPWTWLGKAPVWDLLRLQDSINNLLRVVDDHAAQVAQPGSIHDKNSVSKSTFDTFDTRKPGYKIYQNPLAGKGIQVIAPPALDQAIFEQIKWIMDEMKELAGVADLSKMMQLNQLPSNSTVEAILNSLTPALRFRSRILEAFTRQLAMQLAYNFSQFYTLPMRVTILGPGGVTQDDFDYDPGTLIPDHPFPHEWEEFTDETTGSKGMRLNPKAVLEGPRPRYDRAKEFLRRFA